MSAKRTMLAVLVLAATAAFAQSSDSEKARPVSVSFDSRPEYAEIRVDGKFVGSAPLAYRLTPGTHKIEVARTRYAQWVRELSVADGTPTRVVALLDPATRNERCSD